MPALDKDGRPADPVFPAQALQELIEIRQDNKSYVAVCMYPEGCYPEPVDCQYRASGRVSGCAAHKNGG